MSKLLGSLLRRPYETTDGRDCFYETTAPGGGGPTYILSVVTRSGYEASKAFSEGASQSGAARFAAIKGLGDDAFALNTATGPDYTLWAAKGGFGVSLDVNDLSGPGKRNAQELVTSALERL